MDTESALLIVAIIFVIYTIQTRYTTNYIERFNLDTIKKEVKIGYQEDNPQIQYTVNPVPYLLDFLRGRAYYPATFPRRPDSIINPMREPLLRVALIENQGNMPNYYTPHYVGPNVDGSFEGSKDTNLTKSNYVYRAYRYPHNDMLYKPWQLETSAPYLDYGSQQGDS